MKKKRLYSLFAAILLLITVSQTTQALGTFNNPIRAAESPDPWVLQKDGFYYFLVTTGDGVWIHKSSKLETVGNAARTKVWSSPNGDIKKSVWAPELHYINGKWYIYACGSISATSDQMRMFVLEGETQDALGPYKYIGLLNRNAAAIDENVWQDPETNKLYMAWSQWDPDQSIFIAEMTSPTTLGTNMVKLSSPTASWEQKGWNVNEGPAFIKRNKKLHIIFSVSGCSTSDYALAKLTCSNGDYLNPSAWTKSTGPIFSRNEFNKVWGVGHHGYTKSPDGTEDWLVYHAKSSQTYTNSDRSSRIQIFTWDANDEPVFGEPYPTTLRLPTPSDGTGVKQTITFDPIAAKAITDQDFTPSATTTSNLPITYIIQDGPAVMSNGKIQLTGKPGTVKIWATQAGDKNFCAAWPVSREFKVTGGTITKGDGDGLNASYYNNMDWSNKVLDRNDKKIDFDWGLNAPAPEVNVDKFSVNWSGYVLPLYSDIYNFSIISDNGRRLKVNTKTIIDHLSGDWGKEYVGSVYLTAGKKYPINLDYFEDAGAASIKLYWWSKNQTKQLVPTSQLFTSLTSDLRDASVDQRPVTYYNQTEKTFTVNSPIAMDELLILNCFGKVIQRHSAHGAFLFTFGNPNLPCGMYLIKVACKQTTFTEKIIIR